MGCGVSWKRTEHPREDSHTSWSCLDIAIVCFSRIPRTGKVNVDMQGRATCLPPRMAQSQGGTSARVSIRRPMFWSLSCYQ